MNYSCFILLVPTNCLQPPIKSHIPGQINPFAYSWKWRVSHRCGH